MRFLLLIFFMAFGYLCSAQICPECPANNCDYCWHSGGGSDEEEEFEGMGSGGGGSNIFWLTMVVCLGDTADLYCCCGDGNSYIFNAQTYKFQCLFGGVFACTSVLGLCEPNPSDCDWLCTGGMCA